MKKNYIAPQVEEMALAPLHVVMTSPTLPPDPTPAPGRGVGDFIP